MSVAAEAGKPQTLFEPRTVAAVIAAGILTFVLFLLLLAYADDFQRDGDGRAHALSSSAVGFKGLVRLIELGGGRAELLRSSEEHGVEELVLMFVEARTDPDLLRSLTSGRETQPTLLVLPKWNIVGDRKRTGWVRHAGLQTPADLDSVLSKLGDVKVRQARQASRDTRGRHLLEGYRGIAPVPLQTLYGSGVTPLLTAGDGATIIGQVGEAPLYILADPDLLNNQGLKDAGRARAALALLDTLNSTDAAFIGFDLTLNGFGQSPSPLKLAFEAPYLPLTLALFVAAVLAGLHGAFRFGPVTEEPRAIAFGKAALVENSAALFKIAGREQAAGPGYADLIRDTAAHDSGADAALREGELDAYLDRVSPPDRPPFSALAERARRAGDRLELVAAARALFQWKKDLIK